VHKEIVKVVALELGKKIVLNSKLIELNYSVLKNVRKVRV
jgi:hypothetical protein